MLTKLFIRVGFSISLFVISTVSASIVSAENKYVRITCNLDEVTSIVKIEEVNFHLVTRNAPMDFIANGTITAKPGWRLVQPANGRFDGLGIGETNQYTVISTDGREQSHSGDIVLYKVDVVVDQLTEEIETSPGALIAGPQSGQDICTVTVRCYPDDETNAVIQVSNDGVGILYDTSTSQSITLACFSPQELKTKQFFLKGFIPSDEEGDCSIFAKHTMNNCRDGVIYTVAVILSRTLAVYEPSPENRERRKLGVGEKIEFCVLPDNVSVHWFAGDYQLRANEPIEYQCPSSASNVVIFATPDQHLSSLFITLNVVEPESTIGHRASLTLPSGRTNFPSGLPNQAGVWMYLHFQILPTDVSFENISIQEVGNNSTDATGYFADPTLWNPSLLFHYVSGDFTVSETNNISGIDYAANPTIPTPPNGVWVAGSFSWDIPAVWMCSSNDGVLSINNLDWTRQRFTIDTNGTATVSKFGFLSSKRFNDAFPTITREE